MNKYIASGILIGMIVSLLIPFIFPNLISLDILFRNQANKSLGYGIDYYSPVSGSPLVGGGIFLLLFGIIGGLSGYIVYRVSLLKKNK